MRGRALADEACAIRAAMHATAASFRHYLRLLESMQQASQARKRAGGRSHGQAATMTPTKQMHTAAATMPRHASNSMSEP